MNPTKKERTLQRILAACLLLMAIHVLPAQYLHAACVNNEIEFLGSWDPGDRGSNPGDPVTCDIVIPAGQTVFMTNLTLFLAGNVSITVEEGATFVMQGCTLRSISSTTTWDGIIIEGNPQLGPSAAGQTRVFMKDNLVARAVTAVSVGHFISFFTQTVDGGGVLIADHNTFEDPGKYGIYVAPYELFPTATKIQNNVFKCAQMNTFLAGNDMQFIYLHRVVNTVIRNNSFENNSIELVDGIENLGTGVSIYDGNALLYGNSFTRLTRGVLNRLSTNHVGITSKGFNNGIIAQANTFTNTQYGIDLVGSSPKCHIYRNNFLVDDGNRSLIAPTWFPGREFYAIKLAGNADPYLAPVHPNVRIDENIIQMGETNLMSTHQHLLMVGLDCSGAPKNNELLYINGNSIQSNFPAGYDRQQFNGIQFFSPSGKIYVNCNDFNLDIDHLFATSMKFNNSSAEMHFGNPTKAAGNSFVHPPCGGVYSNRFQIQDMSANMTYYDSPTAPVILPTCVPNQMPVVTATSDNACPAPDAPTIIPNSVPAMQYPPAPKAQYIPAPYQQEGWQLAPNPASDGMVTITLPAAVGSVQVMDLTGRIIRDMPAAATTVQLDVTALPRGVYLVTYQRQGVRSTQRLVLQ